MWWSAPCSAHCRWRTPHLPYARSCVPAQEWLLWHDVLQQLSAYPFLLRPLALIANAATLCEWEQRQVGGSRDVSGGGGGGGGGGEHTLPSFFDEVVSAGIGAAAAAAAAAMAATPPPAPPAPGPSPWVVTGMQRSIPPTHDAASAAAVAATAAAPLTLATTKLKVTSAKDPERFYLLQRAAPFCDGTRTVDEIAWRLGVKPSRLQKTFSMYAELVACLRTV